MLHSGGRLPVRYVLLVVLACHTLSASRAADDSLTLQELSDRFAATKSQYRTLATDDALRYNLTAHLLAVRMFQTRIPGLHLARSGPGPSATHGVGLFVTRDISKGELITCYPGDATLSWSSSGDASEIGGALSVEYGFGAHISDAEIDSGSFFLKQPEAPSYTVRSPSRAADRRSEPSSFVFR